METVLVKLKEALTEANALKTGERSEQQRRLAILCTDLEKLAVWAAYTMEGEASR